MSHFTTIQTEIRDIQALRSACAEMKLALLGNTEARGYGSNTHAGDYVIKLQGPYDIALTRTSAGDFKLVADKWQGHVEREVGRDFGRLFQLYGVHKATMEAQRRGYRVRRKQSQDGSVKLMILGV